MRGEGGSRLFGPGVVVLVLSEEFDFSFFLFLIVLFLIFFWGGMDVDPSLGLKFCGRDYICANMGEC